jgi:hypothetical protein
MENLGNTDYLEVQHCHSIGNAGSWYQQIATRKKGPEAGTTSGTKAKPQ